MTNKTGIIIVEDEGILALNLQMALENNGYVVSGTAISGEDALVMVKNNVPSIALVDITLQGRLNGIEVAKQMRELYGITIIFITGNSDEMTRREAMSIRPAAYLKKPLLDSTLIQTMKTVTANH